MLCGKSPALVLWCSVVTVVARNVYQPGVIDLTMMRLGRLDSQVALISDQHQFCVSGQADNFQVIMDCELSPMQSKV